MYNYVHISQGCHKITRRQCNKLTKIEIHGQHLIIEKKYIITIIIYILYK